jgi:hypothetical protein
MRKFLILVLFASHSSVLAKEGLLNSSYEEVASILGKPSSHDNGSVSGIRYDRYHFERRGWKAAVLFIDGKAQKLDTEKSDGSPLSVEDKKAIFEAYDVPNPGQDSKLRGVASIERKSLHTWRWPGAHNNAYHFHYCFLGRPSSRVLVK